jgi:anthranilate/para-aminobenzoate synthase component I
MRSWIEEYNLTDSIHSLFFVTYPQHNLLLLTHATQALSFYANKQEQYLNNTNTWNNDFSPEKRLKELTLDSFESDQHFSQKHFEVFHFFYEWNQREIFEKKPELPLGLYLKYKKKVLLSLSSLNRGASLNKKKIFDIEKLEIDIRESRYQEIFKEIQHYLISGYAYQINLTSPFSIKVNSTVDLIEIYQLLIQQQKKWGLFFHTTYLPSLNKLFISNSPESLFHLKKKHSLSREEKYEITTRPIKGTWPLPNEESLIKAWSKLRECPKNHAELMMIADLLRNDLAKIQRPLAKMKGNKKKLIVPGLLHQYVILECLLSDPLDLWTIMCQMHPGGSVTGAPKRSVMNIIHEVEQIPRGFYCGSTLLIGPQSISCSLNIRSGTFDFINQSLTGGAGGGITLQSNWRDEYLELQNKAKSFLSLFMAKNIF